MNVGNMLRKSFLPAAIKLNKECAL